MNVNLQMITLTGKVNREIPQFLNKWGYPNTEYQIPKINTHQSIDRQTFILNTLRFVVNIIHADKGTISTSSSTKYSYKLQKYKRQMIGWHKTWLYYQ